jgi:hypothetical protein
MRSWRKIFKITKQIKSNEMVLHAGKYEHDDSMFHCVNGFSKELQIPETNQRQLKNIKKKDNLQMLISILNVDLILK